MVKKLANVIGLVLAVALTPVAMAEMKIAVVDSNKALNQSDAAKRYVKQMESKFGSRVSKLDKLKADVKRLGAKLKKDATAMSDAERSKLQLELKRKAEDYQIQVNQLQAEKNKTDRQQFNQLRPKLKKAIEEVARSGGYDVVLNRGAAFYINPKHDITLKVIQKLNTYR